MALAYALRLLETGQDRQAHQLRRVPRAVPARVGGRGRRRHLLELRPRRRALALRLRLQRRQARLEPGSGAPRCAKPSTSCATPLAPLTEEGRAALCSTTSGPPATPTSTSSSTAARARSAISSSLTRAIHLTAERTRARARTDGAAAPRPTHVHQLRLVLRRDLRHRDRADHRLRGRVLQLAAELFGQRPAALEPAFLDMLEPGADAISPAPATARRSIADKITNMQLGLEEVGAHYAISSIFPSFPKRPSSSAIDVHRRQYEIFSSGRGRVALGRARVAQRHHRRGKEHLLRRAPSRRPEPLRRRQASTPTTRPNSTPSSTSPRRHRSSHAPRRLPRGHPPHRSLLRRTSTTRSPRSSPTSSTASSASSSTARSGM